MSLRMNLYGWSLPAFIQVLGSKNTDVLAAAAECLAESLPNEPGRSTAKAWLRTLIETGYPLRTNRTPAPATVDGGLLTVQMETEAHAWVVDSIVQAIASDDYLEFADESSNWAHPAVGNLYQELSACGFTRSPHCCVEYFSWMAKLSSGSPLFGDDFRTQWSFYTYFTNQELGAMFPVLQAAAKFQRPLPASYSIEAVKHLTTEVSENSKEFVKDLIKWISQIQQAGQDAFIMWW